MENNMLMSNLYVNCISIAKEIPHGNYLKDLPVVKNLKKMGGIRLTKNVTFLVGENGVGKSTLIEGIAVAMGFNPEGGNGLYILDEPEAALSPMRLMRLMCYMQDLVQKDSQFIISTHSPILMTFPGAEVLEITEEGIRAVDYRDTEHFLITKRFMDAPEKMVGEVLKGIANNDILC